MMPCARITDIHACPAPLLVGPIGPPGVPTVLVGGLPSANVTTPTICPTIAPAMGVIVKGSMTVLTGMLPQARVTDLCALGGPITVGMFTVLVGG